MKSNPRSRKSFCLKLGLHARQRSCCLFRVMILSSVSAAFVKKLMPASAFLYAQATPSRVPTVGSRPLYRVDPRVYHGGTRDVLMHSVDAFSL